MTQSHKKGVSYVNNCFSNAEFDKQIVKYIIDTNILFYETPYTSDTMVLIFNLIQKSNTDQTFVKHKCSQIVFLLLILLSKTENK